MLERYIGAARCVNAGGGILTPALNTADQPVGVSKPGRCR